MKHLIGTNRLNVDNISVDKPNILLKLSSFLRKQNEIFS